MSRANSGVEHLRAVLARYKTLVADTQADTVADDGVIPFRPEARRRGSSEHLRDLTYTLDLLVDETARADRKHCELVDSVERALSDARAERAHLREVVRRLQQTVALSLAGLGLVAPLSSIALCLAIASWWRA